MNELDLKTIKNYYLVTEKIASSGQPTAEQFKAIFAANYDVVINLATATSTNALANEGAIVIEQGLVYFHIPVVWDAPKIEDLELFFASMESVKERKVWVHCALNMRVSCFLYLYQKYILKLSEDLASYPMREIWQPDGVWRELIEKAREIYKN